MPEYVPTSRAIWQDNRQRRFASAFQTPASGQPIDKMVIAQLDYLFSKSAFDLDMTTTDDFVLSPEIDDTGRIILGTNTALACDVLIWNGTTQNFLLDRVDHRIYLTGIDLNTDSDVNVGGATVTNTLTVGGLATVNELSVNTSIVTNSLVSNTTVNCTTLNVSSASVFSDAVNLEVGTTTGTTIGTNATQKLSLWGVTPVIQQSHIVDAGGSLADVTAKFNILLGQLENTGILAVA